VRHNPPLIPRRRSHRTLFPKTLACALLVAAALVSAVARPAVASASTPCWKTLLTDWYDGRIDNTYPLHCYQDALKHLPPDVRTYSSAHDDILRALQSAKAKLKQQGHVATPTTPIAPPPTTTTKTPGKTGSGKRPRTRTTPVTTPTTPSPGRNEGKGISHLANTLNPSSPSSLPLPLLVLGGLALLLVAAGAAGMVVKRRQARRPGT
jgi:hypothetical protein